MTIRQPSKNPFIAAVQVANELKKSQTTDAGNAGKTSAPGKDAKFTMRTQVTTNRPSKRSSGRGR
jgi:hypothetical protein